MVFMVGTLTNARMNNEVMYQNIEEQCTDHYQIDIQTVFDSFCRWPLGNPDQIAV